MAIPKERGLKVVSKGYDLRRNRELETRERVTIDDIIAQTGLAKATVRRFVTDADADVSGSPMLAAAIMAEYFGVSMGEMVELERVEGAAA